MAVVGGGITGLTAALALSEHESRPTVTLFEEADRLGGKIRTVEVGDGFVEAGPDSFLVREPWAEELCRRVGLADDLISPDVFGAAVLVNGELRPFPKGSLWGLPTRPSTALRAEALSWRGRIRALGDLVGPGPLRGPDTSVADLVRERFGAEVLERLVDPLLAGTRAGSTSEMSLAAALPQVDALARSYRSIMRGARAQGAAASGPPPFRGIRGGMERLTRRLESSLSERVMIHTRTGIRRIRTSRDGYELIASEGSVSSADAVVLCTPAPAAAEMLRDLSPPSSSLLGAVRYASVASIALRFRPGSVATAPGTSGVLVPSSEGRAISACTWWSSKWPEASGEAQIVRCFVGRSSNDALEGSDDELASKCVSDLRAITGSASQPLDWTVTRWSEGLPEYQVGHLDRLAEVDAALADHPRLALAGAGYGGSGVPDCIAQAHRAVQNIMGAPGPA
ncbi:MAG: protoporphyrinogen oxidase [Actinomycetota bacterium]|nr:protoporphyrinogen oxidase [Actinomycetota bacterium]